MGIPNSGDILQAVIDATPDAIFVKDLDGRYVLVNEAFASFLGRSPADVIGKNDFELYPEATARQFIEDDRRVLTTGGAQAFEGVATSGLSTQAYLVTKGVYRGADGRILGLYGISHDITELRKAHETLDHTREALFRAQKMEAVGQLTGGIAHDFNNILAIIIGNIELLRHHLPRGPYADELIDSILRAALHGRELTGHLLAFSRQRQLNPRPVDVTELVEGIVRLLGRTLAGNITISTVASGDPGLAVVDAAALEAAILNIALNARDAMPDGGTLTIRTSRAVVTASPITQDDPAPGAYIRLDIEDTGHGMSPDVAARVFEPFFTTKGGAGGTGLGLSMVYGFARQSGGSVSVSSRPESGTCFTLHLPLAEHHVEDDPGHEMAMLGSVDLHVVLIVEDDAAVRATLGRQVESLGHRVIAAGSSDEALKILATDSTVDVLLTDVVLGPGIDGIDLANAARLTRAKLPVIFLSGYAAVPSAQQRIAALGAPLLSKPATMSQLERVIDDVCEAREHS